MNQYQIPKPPNWSRPQTFEEWKSSSRPSEPKEMTNETQQDVLPVSTIAITMDMGMEMTNIIIADKRDNEPFSGYKKDPHTQKVLPVGNPDYIGCKGDR